MHSTHGLKYRLPSATSLADAVIAKKGGEEGLDIVSSRAIEEGKVASLLSVCQQITDMVNKGDLDRAVALVQVRNQSTGRNVQDTAALQTVSNVYHQVELDRPDHLVSPRTSFHDDMEPEKGVTLQAIAAKMSTGTNFRSSTMKGDDELRLESSNIQGGGFFCCSVNR